MRPPASRAIRAAAWGAVAVGLAAPLLRRRLNLRPAAVVALAGGAPIGICIAVPRSRTRDVATCCLQMWAYVAAYKMPNDQAEALARRVHIDYPLAIDRVIGLGRLPTQRLQSLLAQRGRFRTVDKVLIWAHWMWFLVPHGALVWILMRHRERLPRAAALMYAVFDLGVIGYWVLPTAPPWYAATQGRLADADNPTALRRMMYEYGEDFWRDGWQPLYSLLGGNPLAAMPSLHFATSVMAAHLLSEQSPIEGAVGWSYAATLGFALVYLGEHYVIDLLAGLALTESVRLAAPRSAPLLGRLSRAIAAVQARARA
ncbi:MAG TPA: phosphatase PAP2 family protein [Solirubrobacteraceae bacterium]|nr:phosphatase PAP2 family protein [Solirubrobacteraceae bacterium]